MILDQLTQADISRLRTVARYKAIDNDPDNLLGEAILKAAQSRAYRGGSVRCFVDGILQNLARNQFRIEFGSPGRKGRRRILAEYAREFTPACRRVAPKRTYDK